MVKGALCIQSKTVCIKNNTEDSLLFTKETILVYISPFSIFNTWPLHLQVLSLVTLVPACFSYS